MIPDDPHLVLRLAANARDLRAAQRLRYTVFVDELGGDGPLVDHAARLEADAFDPLFDHLLLIDTRRDPAALEDVVPSSVPLISMQLCGSINDDVAAAISLLQLLAASP